MNFKICLLSVMKILSYSFYIWGLFYIYDLIGLLSIYITIFRKPVIQIDVYIMLIFLDAITLSGGAVFWKSSK